MNSGGVRRNALLPTTNTRDWQSMQLLHDYATKLEARPERDLAV